MTHTHTAKICRNQRKQFPPRQQKLPARMLGKVQGKVPSSPKKCATNTQALAHTHTVSRTNCICVASRSSTSQVTTPKNKIKRKRGEGKKHPAEQTNAGHEKTSQTFLATHFPTSFLQTSCGTLPTFLGESQQAGKSGRQWLDPGSCEPFAVTFGALLLLRGF